MDLKFIDACVTHENAHRVFRQCADNTIVDFVLSDLELNVPKGYAIEMSASKSNHFARPYAPRAIPFYKSDIEKEFVPKTEWDYDFCYLGSADTTLRKNFFFKFKEYMSKRPNLKFKVVIFDDHFFKKSESEQKNFNLQNRYDYAMQNSKFALCPDGHGYQTIRFYEAMSVDTVPIKIGASAIGIESMKMPLDWIIHWDQASFKVGLDKIINGRFDEFFDNLANISVDKINEMRKYIHGIYREYLMENDQCRLKFRQLVADRICQIKNCQS